MTPCPPANTGDLPLRISPLFSLEKIRLLEEGFELEGKKTWPAKVHIIARKPATTTLEITIHEGRKRQVRKMFAAIGHRVLALKRIAYGGLRLGALPIGKYRRLTPADLALILS